MDIEKLIERLRSYTYWLGQDGPESHDIHPLICDEAADAISMLQAENAKLRAELQKSEHDNVNLTGELAKVAAELKQVKRALAMMWFAYVNSDKDFPHSYETEALAEAERLLGPWAECMPKYLKRNQKEG